MTAPKTYTPNADRFCNKCRKWKSQEGGTGAGRSYRCGGCNAARLAKVRAPCNQDDRGWVA